METKIIHWECFQPLISDEDINFYKVKQFQKPIDNIIYEQIRQIEEDFQQQIMQEAYTYKEKLRDIQTHKYMSIYKLKERQRNG